MTRPARTGSVNVGITSNGPARGANTVPVGITRNGNVQPKASVRLGKRPARFFLPPPAIRPPHRRRRAAPRWHPVSTKEDLRGGPRVRRNNRVPPPRPLSRPPSRWAPHPPSDPPRAIRSRSVRPPGSPSRQDPLRFPVCRDRRLRLSPRRQRRLPSVRRRPLRQSQLLPLPRQLLLRRLRLHLHLLPRQLLLRRLHPLQLRSRHRQPGPHPLPRLNPVREAGRLSPVNPFPDKRRRKLSPDKSLRAQRGASTAVPCRRPISPNAESKIFAASAASAARKAVVGLSSRNRATEPSFAKATA